MIIALDYDNTYTAAPVMWGEIVDLMWAWDHEVYIVTARSEEFDKIESKSIESMLNTGLLKGIIYCDGEPKKQVCLEQGIEINIWIDDNPYGVEGGSTFTPEQLAEWRANGRK